MKPTIYVKKTAFPLDNGSRRTRHALVEGGTEIELALAISTLEHEELSYVAQLGVKGVILGGTGITEQLQWDYLSLLNVKSRLDLYGLKIAGIENIPEALWRDARVGGPDCQRRRQVRSRMPCIGRVSPCFGTRCGDESRAWRGSVKRRGRLGFQ